MGQVMNDVRRGLNKNKRYLWFILSVGIGLTLAAGLLFKAPTKAAPAGGSPLPLVVTFIALLELSKEGLLEVTQAEAYAPIYVRLAYTPS